MLQCPDQVLDIAQVLAAFLVRQTEGRAQRCAMGRVRDDALRITRR
jgi:hypothetical protein